MMAVLWILVVVAMGGDDHHLQWRWVCKAEAALGLRHPPLFEVDGNGLAQLAATSGRVQGRDAGLHFQSEC